MGVPRTGTDWLKSQAKRVTDGEALPVTASVAAVVEVEAWLQRHGVAYAPPAAVPMAVVAASARPVVRLSVTSAPARVHPARIAARSARPPHAKTD